jgi:hypothetical protein
MYVAVALNVGHSMLYILLSCNAVRPPGLSFLQSRSHPSLVHPLGGTVIDEHRPMFQQDTQHFPSSAHHLEHLCAADAALRAAVVAREDGVVGTDTCCFAHGKQNHQIWNGVIIRRTRVYTTKMARLGRSGLGLLGQMTRDF